MLISYDRKCLNLKWKRRSEYLQFGEIASLTPVCNIFLKFIYIVRVLYPTWQRIPKFWTRVLEGSKTIRISMKLRLMEATLVSKIVICQFVISCSLVTKYETKGALLQILYLRSIFRSTENPRNWTVIKTCCDIRSAYWVATVLG